ncbi:MAG: tRNA pseudouridine(38-40) synthase TruA [Terriglobales bacterium]
MTELRTLRLCLSYDGRPFHGWQVQPGKATVQQTLSDALYAVTGERALVHGSGRTDAGVHALGQVAHVRLQARLPAANLQRALNAKLPASVRVLAVEEAAADFHARHQARGKLYRYRIYREPVCPPFLAGYVYHHPYPLDEAAMIAAAPAFEGRHDFRSFAATPEKHEPAPAGTVRTVWRSEMRREGPELVYEITGEGFLHHMVRNLVGFLFDVGRGARSGAEIAAVLAARRRQAAGPTAPAGGLYLVRVDYD